MKQWKKFVPITKVDATQRLVYGTAALEQADKSGEIFDYETSKPLFQKWSTEMAEATGGRNLGNVRAMHGKVAAGRLTEVDYNDEAKQIDVCAYIQDDEQWAKVQDAIYTGFSIGGDYVKTWQDNGLRRYTASIAEVSIVDNPAMPGAHFTMVKANGAQEDRAFAKYVTMENEVFVTNDQVVACAQAMAKAAGAPSFADFIAAAREELTKGENLSGQMESVPKSESGMVRPSGAAMIKPGSSVENDHKVPDGEGFGADGDMVSTPKPSAPGNTASADAKTGNGSNTETQPNLPIGGKAATPTNVDPRNEVRQGWQAKDGSFHVTKAAAMEHNDKLNDPASALEAALAKAAEAVSTAKKGGDPNDSPKINAEEKRKAKKEDGMENAAGDPAVPENLPQPDTTTHPMKAADGAKPYGDVKYADPGYKADKKKRYPIETEKHIRAAWSYIHKPKNQQGYTAAQVSSIKSKIVGAWKEVIGGEPPEANTKAFSVNSLQKGLCHVARLAHLIEELVWLQNACEMEEEWEKDTSPVPAQMKGDIASLVGTLKNMLDEESAELFTPDELVDFVEILEMAAGGVDKHELQKFTDYLGAKTLNKSNGNISTIHAVLKAAKMPQEHMDKIQAMHDHCCSMGAKCDEGNMGKAAGGNGLDKAYVDRLEKQNARLTDLVEKATGKITELAADIAQIKEQPLVTPPYRLAVVGKGETPTGLNGEGGGFNPQAELLKQFTPDQLAVAALKLTHSAGGHVVNTRR